MKIYEVKINNKVVNAYYWNQVVGLWQGISEESEELSLNVPEERLNEWEDLDGNNIKEFLENAAKGGFIEDYDIEDIGGEYDAKNMRVFVCTDKSFSSVYETLSEEEAEEKLTIDSQLHIGIAENGNVYAELEDESAYLKVGEYIFKDDTVSFTPNRSHYWTTKTVSEKCDDERLLIDRIFYLMNYCNNFDFDDYSIETDEIERTLDFYDENGRHFASLTDVDAYDQMHYKLLAGGDPVADLWEYEEDEEEQSR